VQRRHLRSVTPAPKGGGRTAPFGPTQLRRYRDFRVARVYDGSSEVQQIVIAQRLRKGDVETRLGT
jgi:hypothetical protein